MQREQQYMILHVFFLLKSANLHLRIYRVLARMARDGALLDRQDVFDVSLWFGISLSARVTSLLLLLLLFGLGSFLDWSRWWGSSGIRGFVHTWSRPGMLSGSARQTSSNEWHSGIPTPHGAMHCHTGNKVRGFGGIFKKWTWTMITSRPIWETGTSP